MAIHIKVACSIEEQNAVYECRAKMISEASQTEVQNVSLRPIWQVERFDTYNTTDNIIIFDGINPIGTIRVSEFSKETYEIANSYYDFFKSCNGKIMCIDAFMIDSYYDDWEGLFIASLKFAIYIAKSHLAEHIFILAPKKNTHILERSGFFIMGKEVFLQSHPEALVPMIINLKHLRQPLLENISHPLWADLGISIERSIYVENEIICREGQDGDSAYLIVRGSICVTSFDTAGGEVLLGMSGQGEILGEIALIDAGKRMASLRSYAQQTDVLVLRRNAFKEKILADPNKTELVFKLLVSRIRNHASRVVSLVSPNVIPIVIQILCDAAYSRGIIHRGLLLGVNIEFISKQVGRPPKLIKKLLDIIVKKGFIAWKNEGLWVQDLEGLNNLLEKSSTQEKQDIKKESSNSKKVLQKDIQKISLEDDVTWLEWSS